MGRKRKDWLPFEEARKIVRSKGIRTIKDYLLFVQKQSFNLPSQPRDIYGELWSGWRDWLGTKRTVVSIRQFLPFEDARTIVRSKGLKTIKEYHIFIKKQNLNLPHDPQKIYREQWISFYDWFGKKKKKSLSFNEAREIAQREIQKHNINSVEKWYDYCKSDKKSKYLTVRPDKIYKGSGWIDWFDWFGKDHRSPMKKDFLPFSEALIIVRQDAQKYNLNDGNDWTTYKKTYRPPNIPSSPWITYKDNGWVSMGHWLGRELLFFSDAFLAIEDDIKKYNIDTGEKFSEYVRNGFGPKNIPIHPDMTYKNKGWISWRHWLRTDCVPESKSLSNAFPEIIKKYWDFENNIKNPIDISYGERTIVNLKCEKNHKWKMHVYEISHTIGCPYCLHKRVIREESFGYQHPDLLRYWDYDKNSIDPYNIYGGSGKKAWLVCEDGHRWQRKIDHIVNRGDTCPYCTHVKIKLKDGTICDSMIEAYYCLLLKQCEILFIQNRCYPELKLRYDFYVPSLRLYIETTSYNDSVGWWDSYFFKIQTKKEYVENQLGCTFEFINRQLTSSEMRFVTNNIYRE